MAFVFDLNNNLLTNYDKLLAWKNALKANGMTVEEIGRAHV